MNNLIELQKGTEKLNNTFFDIILSLVYENIADLIGILTLNIKIKKGKYIEKYKKKII